MSGLLLGDEFLLTGSSLSGSPVSRLSVGRFSDVRLPAALFPGRLMPEFLLFGAYAENALPESCSMLPGWLLSGFPRPVIRLLVTQWPISGIVGSPVCCRSGSCRLGCMPKTRCRTCPMLSGYFEGLRTVPDVRSKPPAVRVPALRGVCRKRGAEPVPIDRYPRSHEPAVP